MSTSEPNKNAPPSPVDPAVGNVSPLALVSAFGSPVTLLPQATLVSPGSQIHPVHPHVHAYPPTVECPAKTTELKGWEEWELIGSEGRDTNSITAAQRQMGKLSRLIQVSPLRCVGAMRQSASGYANTLCQLLDKIKDIAYLTRALIRLAEITYGRRDLELLANISAVLRGLPGREAQSAGLYYQAIILRRARRYEASKQLLEYVSASAPPFLQARALQTLGTVYEAQNEWDEAIRLYTEALRAAHDVDGFAVFGAIEQLAVIKSIAGDHKAALSDIQSLWPVVRSLSPHNPHVFFQFHNELAVELAAVGRIEEASAACRIAMASPIATAYPEWQETAAEIAEQQPSKAMVAVALPQAEAEPTDADTAEERPRLPIQHRFATPRRLPFAQPSPTLACLLICAPVRAPTARP
jgi:tetratricopeptide (TPR) repeat protein